MNIWWTRPPGCSCVKRTPTGTNVKIWACVLTEPTWPRFRWWTQQHLSRERMGKHEKINPRSFTLWSYMEDIFNLSLFFLFQR